MGHICNNNEGFTEAQVAIAYWFIDKVQRKGMASVKNKMYADQFWVRGGIVTYTRSYNRGELSLKKFIQIVHQLNDKLDNKPVRPVHTYSERP